jgi:fatty-acyl-CoA synthase
VCSPQIESLISLHPAVAEVAVVGVPDERWDERPLALVVLAPDAELDAGTLQQHLMQFVSAGQISKWAVPEEVHIVDTMPKTSVGKLDKKLIRAQLQEL